MKYLAVRWTIQSPTVSYKSEVLADFLCSPTQEKLETVCRINEALATSALHNNSSRFSDNVLKSWMKIIKIQISLELTEIPDVE